MAVPDYQSLMLPLLRALADGEDMPFPDVCSRVATAEDLSAEDVRELVPSGRETTFAAAAGWALHHLRRAGLAKRVRRGVYRLTLAGRNLLADAPSRIDLRLLRTYPRYDRKARSKTAVRTGGGAPADQGTAEEAREAEGEEKNRMARMPTRPPQKKREKMTAAERRARMARFVHPPDAIGYCGRHLTAKDGTEIFIEPPRTPEVVRLEKELDAARNQPASQARSDAISKRNMQMFVARRDAVDAEVARLVAEGVLDKEEDS